MMHLKLLATVMLACALTYTGSEGHAQSADDGKTTSLVDRSHNHDERIGELDRRLLYLEKTLVPDLQQQIRSGHYVKHAVAQGACLAIAPIAPPGAWIRAAWRPLLLPSNGNVLDHSTWTGATNDNRMTCSSVCQQLIEHEEATQEKRAHGRMQCFDTFHIYRSESHYPAPFPRANTDLTVADTLGYKVYRYGQSGCEIDNIGPNTCCCATVPP